MNLLELAKRATLLQMHAGPYPVLAPAEVWEALASDKLVRAAPALPLSGVPAGWQLTTEGYAALDALRWGNSECGRAAPVLADLDLF